MGAISPLPIRSGQHLPVHPAQAKELIMSSKLFTSLAVSVDGFITGRDPYRAETPSKVVHGFRLDEVSARVFDAIASRVRPAVASRKNYDELPMHRGRVRRADDRTLDRLQPRDRLTPGLGTRLVEQCAA
jgi:hypothetical protein